MERQLAFNDALMGIMNQGELSFDEDGGCAYRSPNGNKCTIGHLIPDENYNPNLEGVGAGQPEVRRAIDEKYGYLGPDFTRNMQRMLHDGHPVFIRGDIIKSAKRFAHFYDLEMPDDLSS